MSNSNNLIIKNGVVTLIDKHGESHEFNNGREILNFTENVGLFAMHEMFEENQIDFLMYNGRC